RHRRLDAVASREEARGHRAGHPGEAGDYPHLPRALSRDAVAHRLPRRRVLRRRDMSAHAEAACKPRKPKEIVMNAIAPANLPVAVIGAGPVGLAAAARLVERGLRPVIFEKGERVGAAILEW